MSQGFSGPDAVHAYRAFSSFLLGHLLLEVSALGVDTGPVDEPTPGSAEPAVTAEVLGLTKGPKIVIQKYKNKTGYKKRQGHRQKYTQVKITGIK